MAMANVSDPENPVVDQVVIAMANISDSEPENPAPAPSLLYSAATTELAGSTDDCAICLGEFEDGDAIRIMPACHHGFHTSCIDSWLAGGLRSSCPMCRAPVAVAVAVATAAAAPAAQQPVEATNQPEAQGDNSRNVASFVLICLHLITMLITSVGYFLGK